MSLLDQVGVGHPSEAANIRLFGHIEGILFVELRQPGARFKRGPGVRPKTTG